jgi:hypothetical protein
LQSTRTLPVPSPPSWSSLPSFIFFSDTYLQSHDTISFFNVCCCLSLVEWKYHRIETLTFLLFSDLSLRRGPRPVPAEVLSKHLWNEKMSEWERFHSPWS